MSKLTEAFNILFGDKAIVIGNTSFKVHNDSFVCIRGADGSQWGVSLSKLGPVSLKKISEDEQSNSQLVIKCSGNELSEILLQDSYALNEKKLEHLLSLKAKKAGAFSLMTIFYIVLAFIVAMTIFGIASNGGGTKVVDNKISNLSESTINAKVAPTSTSSEYLSPEQQLRERNSQLTKPNPELAALLEKGAKTGDYSFTLGGDIKTVDKSKETLYVFSDPLCPRCQDLEPLLEQLSADYRVEIFPVSVIGTPVTIEASSNLVKNVLCTAPDSRSAAWTKVMRDPSTPTVDCEAGPIALRNNIDTFHAYKFIGTPAIVRNDGASFDLTKKKSAESITRWLGEASQ
jgi:TrbB protein